MVTNTFTPVNFAEPVQDILPNVEARMRAISTSYHQDLRDAIDHILDAGGKRIRPTVNLLIGGMLGADTERLITSAAAIEMLHTATLVHDDLIDGALLRRGNPTLNASWTPAKTVLTGDLIFSYAAVLASETDSVMVVRLFAETLATIVNGEITQQFTSLGRANREDYYARIHAKTASLFEAATASAAYLSPVDDELIEQVRHFGYEIGMAFQIMDDVLDFTAEQSEVGKPIGSDLRQGLITLPAIYFFEENQDLFSNIAGENGGSRNENEMKELVDRIRHSSSIDKSIEEARKFIVRSKKTLSTLPDCPEKIALSDLANFIIDRDI